MGKLEGKVAIVTGASQDSGYGASIAQSEGRADPVSERISLGRMGDLVTDIGQTIAFLASNEGRFMTGSAVAIDGAMNYLC